MLSQGSASHRMTLETPQMPWLGAGALLCSCVWGVLLAQVGTDPKHQPSMVPLGMSVSQAVPAHAGHAHKCVAACMDSCLLGVFSRGVHMPTTPLSLGWAPGDPHTNAGPENLNPATLWGCLCHAELPASIVPASSPSVYPLFSPFFSRLC